MHETFPFHQNLLDFKRHLPWNFPVSNSLQAYRKTVIYILRHNCTIVAKLAKNGSSNRISGLVDLFISIESFQQIRKEIGIYCFYWTELLNQIPFQVAEILLFIDFIPANYYWRWTSWKMREFLLAFQAHYRLIRLYWG